MLKDIPNVFFKVSKRKKADETLQVLHRILFKRKANARLLKRNIFQFSGFVWGDDEKIQKGRVKERLDKCTKDRLLDLSELLDLQIRSSTKKEEFVGKLLEFLQSPQSTRDAILAEKEKKGKKKRKSKTVRRTVKGGASSERKQKKQKSSPGTEVKKRKKRSRSDEVEKENEIQGSLSEKEDEDGQSSALEENSDGSDFSYKAKLPNSKKDDDGLEENDQVKSMDEDETDKLDTSTATIKSSEAQNATELKINGNDLPTNEGAPKPVLVETSFNDVNIEDVPPRKKDSKGRTSKVSKPNTKEKAASSKKASAKIAKTKSNSSPTKNSVDVSACDPPLPSKSKKESKKKEPSSENSAPGDTKLVKKPASKNATQDLTKEHGKDKASGKANAGPSKEELHSVISNILKEVDVNTATLADLIGKLGAHFNMDLMDRKKEVKQIIEVVMNNMTDEEDDSEKEED